MMPGPPCIPPTTDGVAVVVVLLVTSVEFVLPPELFVAVAAVRNTLPNLDSVAAKAPGGPVGSSGTQWSIESAEP